MLIYVLVLNGVIFPFVQGLGVSFLVFCLVREWKSFATDFVQRPEWRHTWKQSALWLLAVTYAPLLLFTIQLGPDWVLCWITLMCGVFMFAFLEFFWLVWRLAVAPNSRNMEVSWFKAGNMSPEVGVMTINDIRMQSREDVSSEEEELVDDGTGVKVWRKKKPNAKKEGEEEQSHPGEDGGAKKNRMLANGREMPSFLKASDYTVQIDPSEHIDAAVLNRSALRIFLENMWVALTSQNTIWIYKVLTFWLSAFGALWVVFLGTVPLEFVPRLLILLVFIPFTEYVFIVGAGRRYLREVFLDRVRFLSVARTRNVKGLGPRFVLVSAFVSFHALAETMRFVIVLNSAVRAPKGTLTFVWWMAV